MIILNFYNNEENVGHIKFKQYDNLASKYFQENILQTKQETSTSNTSFDKTKLDIINNYVEFQDIVNKINSFDYSDKIELDFSTPMTLQKLFDAHEYFEVLGEKKRTGILPETPEIKAMWSLANRMNTLIHKMEGTPGLTGTQWYQALFDKPIIRTDLDDDLIKEAVMDYEENKIYIGYGETGKNLHHAFQQNEVELVQRKMVQPQRSILTEFFVAFGDMPLRWDRYEDWCIKNDVVSYGYDYTNPIYYGKWAIGEIVGKSFKELEDFPVHTEVRINFE